MTKYKTSVIVKANCMLLLPLIAFIILQSFSGKGLVSALILNNESLKDAGGDSTLFKQEGSKSIPGEKMGGLLSLDKNIPGIFPVSKEKVKNTPSGYGYRFHPILKIRKFHYGIDFGAPLGTEIYATADGVVIAANKSVIGYGNKVVLKHNNDYETLYAHMLAIRVNIGEEVKQGQVIGYVGNSGMSTGPHLHYEVHKEGKKVNPGSYLGVEE